MHDSGVGWTPTLGAHLPNADGVSLMQTKLALQSYPLTVSPLPCLHPIVPLCSGKLRPSPVKRERLRPGTVSPPLPLPPHIPRPSYADSGEPPAWSEAPQIHDAEGLKRMEAACQLAAQVLQKAGELVKVSGWAGVQGTVVNPVGGGRHLFFAHTAWHQDRWIDRKVRMQDRPDHHKCSTAP